MGTKQIIVQEVGELFAEKGYLLSMSDISKKVGIKVPSIYSHFESKDQIIYMAIEEELSAYNNYLKELYLKLQDESTENILRGIYFGILDYYSDCNKLKLLRNTDLIPESSLYQKCKKIRNNYTKEQIGVLGEIFEKGYKKGEINFGIDEGYQFLYLTMIRGILEGMIAQRDQVELRKSYERKVWNIFWNLIKERG